MMEKNKASSLPHQLIKTYLPVATRAGVLFLTRSASLCPDPLCGVHPCCLYLALRRAATGVKLHMRQAASRDSSAHPQAACDQSRNDSQESAAQVCKVLKPSPWFEAVLIQGLLQLMLCRPVSTHQVA